MGTLSVSNVNFFGSFIVTCMFFIYHIINGDFITFMPKLIGGILAVYYICMYVLPLSLVGSIGTVINFYMCGATFPMIIPALKTKDPAYVNLVMVGAGTMNSFWWLIFGVLTSDILVLSPQVAGVGLGLL